MGLIRLIRPISPIHYAHLDFPQEAYEKTAYTSSRKHRRKTREDQPPLVRRTAPRGRNHRRRDDPSRRHARRRNRERATSPVANCAEGHEGDAARGRAADRRRADRCAGGDGAVGYIKAEFEPGAGQGGNPSAGDERRKMYQEVLDALRQVGAKLDPMELPQFSTQSLRIILNAEAATAFDDITRDGRVNQLSGQSP